jgi:hypothetical protein
MMNNTKPAFGLSFRLLGCCLLLATATFCHAQPLRLDGRSPVYEAPADKALDLVDEVTLEAWLQADPMPAEGGRILDKMPPGSMEGYLLDTWPGNSLRLRYGNALCEVALPKGANRTWTAQDLK